MVDMMTAHSLLWKTTGDELMTLTYFFLAIGPASRYLASPRYGRPMGALDATDKCWECGAQRRWTSWTTHDQSEDRVAGP